MDRILFGPDQSVQSGTLRGNLPPFRVGSRIRQSFVLRAFRGGQVRRLARTKSAGSRQRPLPQTCRFQNRADSLYDGRHQKKSGQKIHILFFHRPATHQHIFKRKGSAKNGAEARPDLPANPGSGSGCQTGWKAQNQKRRNRFCPQLH